MAGDDSGSQEATKYRITPCEIFVYRSTTNDGSECWPGRIHTNVCKGHCTKNKSDFIYKDNNLYNITD